MSLATDLKIIKDAELDIELLDRENEKECAERNAEIEGLRDVIKSTELILEEELKASGEKKLECKIGYCSYRVMPDKWEYDTDKLIEWAKNSSDEFKERYVKTTEELKKAKIKEDILGEFLIKELSGVTVTPQKPKFDYKIK